MRTISIQADGGPGGNDDVMRGALRYIVTTMPVSDKGFKTATYTTAPSSTTASPVSGWSASGRSATTRPAAAPTPTLTSWCRRLSTASTAAEGGTQAHPGIHADQPNEPVLTRWLAHLVLDIGTGPDGCGITFGSLADGIVVAQRHPGMWSVSFRPNPDGTGMRYYTDPAVVARVVIAREHDETAAVKPPRPARAFVLAV